ncbi:MAG: HEAT repeat domain-containing protein [Gemmatimonadaceae bacterium]
MRAWPTLAAAGLISALGACGRTPAAAVPAPAPSAAAVRPLVAERPAPFTPSLVRLSPDSASKLAREGRAAFSAQVAPGLALSLWAPEGLIADPIGIGFDERGRLFATRTRRTGNNEIDIRGHPDWMVPSITFRDVEDKRAFYQRILAPANSAQNEWLEDFNKDGSRDWRDLAVLKESLYRLEDTNGDGVADLSQLILEDFNDLVSDVAHGVMSYRGDLYLTVSPDIWRLRDTTGDGVIDTKESLARGSGVHIGFGGHGLSSPLIGPDGRLYWKKGDLGVNITTREGRHLANPNSGVILRAEPDGRDAEIYAYGLRNPQEFAFDDYGNLIAPDNDGDHPGEEERLTYVVDGMDSGWRINWQFGKYVDPDNNDYKVWMAEGYFRPRFAGQAAHVTPPFAPWHEGPSGFDCNPGTALSDRWKGYCFAATFPGDPSAAGIRGIRVAPQGAGFRLVEDTVLVRGVLTTGVKFGPDGALYLADWVEGWGTKDRGRIWKVDVAGAPSAARAETRALIAASFKDKSPAELSALLRHADQRVRLKAQFELADRGAARELLAAARQREHQLARVHGIWGIAQLARRDIRQAAPLVALLRDADPEIRAQAAKMLGDVRYAPAAPQLVAMLRDSTPRARFFGAEALGRVRYAPAFAPIVEMLAQNEDRDVYLRHAGALALSRIGPADQVAALATHPSRAVRLAAVVALRRMRDPGVARFLADRDGEIATDAARAINDDGGIEPAVPALAAALDEASALPTAAAPRDAFRTGEPFVRRAINANLRVGTDSAARRVAAYATRASAPEALRAEAVAVLGVWPKPSILDRVDGWHLGQQQRDSAAARAAVAGIAEQLFASGGTEIQVALADAIGRLGVTSAANLVFDRVRTAQAPAVRAASLRALARLGDPRIETALRTALADPDTTVRTAALGAISGLNLSDATKSELLASVVMASGSIPEQQSALQSLARTRGETGRALLTQLVERLAEGKLAPELQLDVAEAARAFGHPPLTARLDVLERRRGSAATVVAYADALRGGNAERGQRVVFGNPAAQCSRCHDFGWGGGNVGPPLGKVGARLTREQLLEALVAPSARIAPGYGVVQVTTKGGEKLFGVLREETDSYVVIEVGSAPRRVAKSDIAQRVNGPSAMPSFHGVLTRREIRDVVEFLSTRR